MTVDLEKTFATYFEEIERCKAAQCYWALLHLLVILPDICAALEANDGKAGKGGPYRNWCRRYFGRDREFTPVDRYALRCVLLHQGRTVTDKGQYSSYSFSQPTPTGEVQHRVVDPFAPEHRPIYRLEISRMAEETLQAIRSWFADLQTTGNAKRLNNVKRHIRWLAREGEGEMIVSDTIVHTFPTTGSTGGFSSL